jgi:solute:Na+ symporter, SSS family
VLSLAAGPVLGAFLVGVLTRRTGTRGMLAGMITGVVVLFIVWKTGATAWTWYALIGATVTALVAMAASYVLDPPAERTARA